MKNALLSTVFLAILVAACAPFSAEQAPEAYSPYYLVTAHPNATATPTPFQPFAPVALNQQSQAPQQAASPTLPAILPTNTPFPTPTTPSTVQPTPELITAAQAVIDARDLAVRARQERQVPRVVGEGRLAGRTGDPMPPQVPDAHGVLG